MIPLHPSETARAGKQIDKSRYIKPSDPTESIIECAQCGFPVDLKTRSTGPSLGAIPDPELKSVTGTPPSPGVSFTDSYGDPVTPPAGCPLCGSMNPQGSGRGRGPWDRVKPTVENL